MKKYLFILLTSCMLHPSSAQTEEPVRERMYLQTDQSLYLAGEWVWIKALTTDRTGKPVTLSKVGYVELIDESAPRIQIKIELKKGVGEGAFFLPATLPTGNYRLAGYTRYMRNEGEAVYFNKLLPVVNTFVPRPSISSPSVEKASPVSLLSPQEGNLHLSLTFPDGRETEVRTPVFCRVEGLPEDVHTLSVSIAGYDSIQAVKACGIEDWVQGLASSPLPPFSGEWLPEYEGHILSGKLIDQQAKETSATDEKPLALLGFAGKNIRLFNGQIDSTGKVTFFTKRITGMQELATAALYASPHRYRVDIQSPFAGHTYTPLPPLELKPEWNEYLLRRSVGLQVLQLYTADSLSRTAGPEEAIFQWVPEWRYRLDEYTRFPTMAEVVIEFIPGLRFRKIDDRYVLSALTEERVGFTQDKSLVLLDGLPITDHGVIYHYNPLQIEEIEVYKGKYAFGGAVFDGIASFKTYQGNYAGLTAGGSIQFFDYEGAQAPRLFYSPSYRTEEQRRSRLPDYRHTLLWNAQVEVHRGQAQIPFTTSDLTGAFLIYVEGLRENGETLYGTQIIHCP
ncbi:MAG: hypothetical protein LBU37_04685 [Tannerellaceae bacterium]|jgi:hypothetical protein|nr:hypothetical protein [Tannerellaceae bacterium]